MANSKQLDALSMSLTPLIKWFQENILLPIGFLQLGVIGGSYLIAWLFAAKIRQHLDKDIEKVKAHMRFVLSPDHFAIVLRHFFWLLLVWFFQALFEKLAMPTELFRMVVNLILVLMAVRFASFYIKSAFWVYFVYVVSIIFLCLRIFKLWDPTVHLLASMTIDIGNIRVSLWGSIEAIVVFI